MQVMIKRDGLNLRGILELPDQDNYDLVILMHGFTANCGYESNDLLYQIANTLLENEYASLRVDFNGHGKSDGKLVDMTVLNEIADGKAILDYVKTLNGVNNIYLLGHSQGGVVASMLAGYYPEVFKGVILMAPAATLKDDALKGTLMGQTYDPDNIPEKICLADKEIGGFYFRIAQQLPIYEVAKNYQGSVCLIHGDNDEVVAPIAATRYHDCYQNSVLHIIKDADHGFHDKMRTKAIEIVMNFIKG